MAIALNNFLGTINGKGYLTNNRFLVNIPRLPAGMSNSQAINDFHELTSGLQFFIESSNLPGIQLNTSDVFRYGYGIVQKRPYGLTFADLTTSVHSDAEGVILRFFQAWMKIIMNYDNRTGDLFDATGLLPSQGPYELGYKSDYAVDMNIEIYNQAGVVTHKVFLIDCYPIFVNDLNLSWSDNNTIMRIPVTFAYKNWYVDELYIDKNNYQTKPVVSPDIVTNNSGPGGRI